MILAADNVHTSSRHLGLDCIAAVQGDERVVLTVEQSHIAAGFLVEHTEVDIHLVTTAANDTVEGVPCSIMSVAEESLYQKCPDPASVECVPSANCANLIMSACIYKILFI